MIKEADYCFDPEVVLHVLEIRKKLGKSYERFSDD